MGNTFLFHEPGTRKLVCLITFPFCILLFLNTFSVDAQSIEGTVKVHHIEAPSLQIVEDIPNRRVTIYLPQGYEDSSKQYPVIYYLHSFTWSDSLSIEVSEMNKIFDEAIATGKIDPVIVVMPNHHTEYRGSFYTNSTLTGNWADFTAPVTSLMFSQKLESLGIEHYAEEYIGGHSNKINQRLLHEMLPFFQQYLKFEE